LFPEERIGADTVSRGDIGTGDDHDIVEPLEAEA
jgi:hypothetical protein